eukprot:TRINITY_DN5484_c0_g2_i1.p1 TRINITY_DN5484_c0_g2~~TRINITY_DN5484_c0_g2_i1.p1  ORF type:complete len:413 (+),score=73.28 TRINITY_DN5484_c0_g2_i1:51-1241(+)
MVLVRANLVKDSGYALAKAVTIAIRYSAVRRQFGAEAGSGVLETKILDYPTQQYSLLPLLASSYAFVFIGRWMMQLFNDTQAKFAAGDYSSMSEIHACTAGLKALTTQVTADGIEECRRRCGGNGYLHASGLPELFATYVPSATFEGDSIILYLQVARFLMKAASQTMQGQRLSGTAQYLARWKDLTRAKCSATSSEDFLSSELQETAFACRATKLVLECAATIAAAEKPEKGFESSTVALTRAAKAHCQLIAVQKLGEARTGLPGSTPGGDGAGVSENLKRLSDLYALSVMETNMGDFLECGFMSGEQASLVREQVQKLMKQLRKSAVQLVDAFLFTDHYLSSAMGRFDGDVYTHLYASALEEPLNATHVAPGMEHLRGLIGQHLRQSAVAASKL